MLNKKQFQNRKLTNLWIALVVSVATLTVVSLNISGSVVAQECYANGTEVSCPSSVTGTGCYQIPSDGGDPYSIECGSREAVCYANGIVVACPADFNGGGGCYQMPSAGGDPYTIGCPTGDPEYNYDAGGGSDQTNVFLYRDKTEADCRALAAIEIPEGATEAQIIPAQREANIQMSICLNTISAEYGSCAPGDTGEECIQTAPIYRTFVQILNFLSAGALLFISVMIAFRGIQYASARSDPQQVAAARNGIVQALIALFLYFFMFAFLQWLIPGGMF